MIHDYLSAGYPALALITMEPHRTEQLIQCDGWTFMVWDCLRGIRPLGSQQLLEEIPNPVDGIQWLSGKQDTVLICHNLHLFLDDPGVIQAIHNGIPIWKATGSCLVSIQPVVQLKPEVEPFFHVIDAPLPGEDELFRLQQDLGNPHNIRPNRKAARISKGLSEFQAETAYSLSLIQKGYFSSKIVGEAKQQMIKKSGLMEFYPPVRIEEVGGLDALKAYLTNRATAYQPENTHLPKPKGLLLVGISGTGKSLSCKAAASILQFPLIRLDIGNLKNSLVGESERRMREATKIIDAFGQCVVFLDEVEKMFAGAKGSGHSDGGTTSGMFSHFLTWMNDKNSALIMATANSISQMPPEFLRAGRFDSVWFVDLPTLPERKEIIKIMNRKYQSDIPTQWAKTLDGFSGAEIEQLARDSLFDGPEAAREAIVPLSRTMREEIDSLRSWARTRARIANTPEEDIGDKRRIRTVIPGDPKKAILN